MGVRHAYCDGAWGSGRGEITNYGEIVELLKRKRSSKVGNSYCWGPPYQTNNAREPMQMKRVAVRAKIQVVFGQKWGGCMIEPSGMVLVKLHGYANNIP